MSRTLRRSRPWFFVTVATLAAVLLPLGPTETATAEPNDIREVLYEGLPIDEFLSDGGMAALFGADTSSQSYVTGGRGNGRYADRFVNDPCLDPAPPGRDGTVQSEPEIAVLNAPGSMAKKMVAGYNNTRGFSDRNRGLSGFAYSTDGGGTWVDGGGLPPLVAGSGTVEDDGKDAYFGDPVVVVHHATQRFFYVSIYKRADGAFTLSVNRGTFQVAPPQGLESASNTRCLNDPAQTGVADPPQQAQERIIWGPPVEAVRQTAEVGGVIVDVAQSQDFLDKPWLYVDQTTGTLYLTYTRFALDGESTLELARCKGCALKGTVTSADWDGPYIIAPNDPETLNQGTVVATTARPGLLGGPPRVVVTWFARTFVLAAAGTTGQAGNRTETQQRIRYAYSDDNGSTWSGPKTIAVVNPQLEPPGYNRGRTSGIANVPSIAVDKGADDGVLTSGEMSQPGFGNVYVTYFSGNYALPARAQEANIFVSRSTDNGTAFGPPVKVNDDPGTTSHVFPTVQVNKNASVFVGWLDRRNDPTNNVLTDAWASVSKDGGQTFRANQIQSDVSTSWSVRSDARPNFGDYISSELLGFGTFVMVWADGRFRPPGGQAATPDTIFTITSGLGM